METLTQPQAATAATTPSSLLVFLDAGHGGIDPTTGMYTTKDSKMWIHPLGNFHSGPVFYEGVFNRTLTYMVAALLQKAGIAYYMVSHEYLDKRLEDRVEMANTLLAQHPGAQGLYLSNHSNAFNTRASGFEAHAFSSSSMILAAEYHEEVERQRQMFLPLEHIKMRSPKRSSFYVLRKTKMPALLIEHLYFDNYNDAKMLMDDYVVLAFAKAQVAFIRAQIAKLQ